MAQNNKIKSFIRLDASGRSVVGSLVNRKSTPKTGRWREILAYECCNPFTLITSTPADVSLTGITFTLLCDDVEIAVNNIATATTTIQDVVDALNASLSIYGVFAVSGTDITLSTPAATKTSLCAGELTFVITQTV